MSAGVEAKRAEGKRDLVTRNTPVFRAGRFACRVELALVHRLKVTGRENVPAEGPMLLVGNHSGGMLVPVTDARSPLPPTTVPRVHCPTDANPSASVSTVSPVTEPLPLVTVKTTLTSGTGLPN